MTCSSKYRAVLWLYMHCNIMQVNLTIHWTNVLSSDDVYWVFTLDAVPRDVSCSLPWKIMERKCCTRVPQRFPLCCTRDPQRFPLCCTRDPQRFPLLLIMWMLRDCHAAANCVTAMGLSHSYYHNTAICHWIYYVMDAMTHTFFQFVQKIHKYHVVLL